MKSLINLMIENGVVNLLYVGNKAYVTAERIENDSIVSKLARESAGEAFLYGFVAKDGIKDANKEKADKLLSGTFVVRYIHADKRQDNKVVSL